MRIADARRRPALGAAHRVRAAHRIFDIRPRQIIGALALEIMIVERRQHVLVKFDAGEFRRRRPGVRYSGHAQLLRPARAQIAVDVAARVQLHLAPDPARIERHLDAIEHFEGAAFAPERVIGRMLGEHAREVGVLIARRAARRIAIDETVLIPPVTGKEIARDAAMVGAGAVGVRQSVMRAETGERRRRQRAHEPLQHAEIRLTDAADLVVRPGLRADPFDHVVKIVLLAAAEKFELSAGAAAAAHVHVDVGIALLDIPFDRPGLAPQELRARRQTVVVEAIGRRRQQRRIRAGAVRPVDARTDRGAVTDSDLNDVVDHWCNVPAGGTDALID